MVRFTEAAGHPGHLFGREFQFFSFLIHDESPFRFQLYGQSVSLVDTQEKAPRAVPGAVPLYQKTDLGEPHG